MAGIYPVGMRLAAGWARGDIGLLVGLLVGALTLGSASPHLFLALGGLDWRPTLLAGSASAAVGALLILGVREGPATRRPARFRPAHVLRYWIRSEDRRGGKECVRPCRSWWCPYH